jgi:hypothetical protein
VVDAAAAAAEMELLDELLAPQPLRRVTQHTNRPNAVSALTLNAIATCS